MLIRLPSDSLCCVNSEFELQNLEVDATKIDDFLIPDRKHCVH